MRRITIALLLAFICCGCRATRYGPLAPRHLFGPVIANDILAGRIEGPEPGVLTLLVAERALVRIDLSARTWSRHDLAIGANDRCWGLAGLTDGTVWSVCEWKNLLQVAADGRVVKTVTMKEPYVNLIGDGDRLIYQRAEFDAPAQALFEGPPDAVTRRPWSQVRTRSFDLARPYIAPMNIVSCGLTRTGERPCWFPDAATLFLIRPDGTTRQVRLEGVASVTPEVLLTSDAPPRPIRDAFVASDGSIWVLTNGSGVASPPIPGSPLIGHFAVDGRAIALRPLAEAARLILTVTDRRVTVLTGNGFVAEVTP